MPKAGEGRSRVNPPSSPHRRIIAAVAESGPVLQHRGVLTALRAWPEYVRLLFFPKDLSNDYSPAIILPVESISTRYLNYYGADAQRFAS